MKVVFAQSSLFLLTFITTDLYAIHVYLHIIFTYYGLENNNQANSGLDGGAFVRISLVLTHEISKEVYVQPCTSISVCDLRFISRVFMNNMFVSQ